MDALYRGGVAFFSFTLPVCKLTTDYRVVFKNYLDDPLTASLIDMVVQTRAAMSSSLSDRTLAYENKISSVEGYLQALNTLYQSLLAQGGVKVSQSLQYEWQVYLTGTGESFKSSDMIFELIMLHHLKALLLYYLAKNLLETDARAFLSEAAKSFLSASAIMDYLVTMLVPEHWAKRLHTSAPNPLETSAAHCGTLSLYYRTCAQACAALKAMDNPSASALVRARVAVAVINYASRTVNGLVELRAPLRPFVAQVALTRELFTALAAYGQAQSCYEKSEVGAALGMIGVARAHLSDQQDSKFDPARPGWPKPAATPGVFTAAKAVLADKLTELFVVADRDNRFVHFQQSTVLPLPAEAAVMVPPVPYVLPVGSLVEFKLNAKTSFFSGLFGGFGGKEEKKEDAAAGPAPAAVEPSVPSDGGLGVYQGLNTPVPVPPMAPAGQGQGPAPPAPPAGNYTYNQTSYPVYTPAYTPAPTAPTAPYATAPPAASAPLGAYGTYQPGGVVYGAPAMSTDEAYARQLQAQLDRERQGQR